MSKIDLHLHTTASDGRFTPAGLVAKTAALGLEVIAITDHDTVAGVAPAQAAARAFSGLTVISGVEINTDVPQGEAHLLGYFVNDTDDNLINNLENLRSSRELWAQKMLAKLAGLGLDVRWSRVQELAGSATIGRPHIALALLEKGYITSFSEAFTRYIGREGPAYVEREKITQEAAVALVLAAGGLPVLAHPFTVGEVEPMLRRLKEAGLVGLEAYYKDYSPARVRELVGLARKYRLLVTGGSDYHGLDENTETMPGAVKIPPEVADKLFALAGARGLLKISHP
ncbi:MAG: PHP domain-containing protein [Chloroflexota bacterium]